MPSPAVSNTPISRSLASQARKPLAVRVKTTPQPRRRSARSAPNESRESLT
jgi:hypothetical protein